MRGSNLGLLRNYYLDLKIPDLDRRIATTTRHSELTPGFAVSLSLSHTPLFVKNKNGFRFCPTATQLTPKSEVSPPLRSAAFSLPGRRYTSILLKEKI